MDTHAPEDPLGGETLNFPAGHPWRHPVRWLYGLVLGGCALYALLFLYHGLCLVIYPFDADNSEAYLVYQGQRLTEGSFLYKPLNQEPYLVDNYPPLYPLLLALGYTFTGPNFHWPRALSLSATVLTAMLIGFWTYHRTRNQTVSFLAGMLYLSFYHVYDWGALARVDAVGVALALSGLMLFEVHRSWKAALPFFLLALFTRQTLYAAPLAVACTLAGSSNRKTAVAFLGGLTAGTAALYLVLLLLSSGEAWNHLVLYNANEFRWSDVWVYLRQWLFLYTVWGCAPLVILMSEYPGQTRPGAPRSPVLFWYTLFALGEAVLCGKIGSAPNYLLSLVAAAAVGMGTLLYQAQTEGHRQAGEQSFAYPMSYVFLLAAFVLQIGATWHWPHRMDFSYTPTRADAQAGRMLQNELRRTPGPILSDRAGVALMAGHPPVFEPFIGTQLVRQGLWDQSPLLARIAARAFPKVILQFNLEDDNWDRERFTPELIAALREHYTRTRTLGPYRIYEPKK
ncbi:MAG: hypothetical protein ACE15F_07765 [bacterium]